MPPCPVLEKWLQKHERIAQRLQTDIARQWAAIPRRPDMFSGDAEAQDPHELDPYSDGQGCPSGVNDFPYFCPPRFFDLFVNRQLVIPFQAYTVNGSATELESQTFTLERVANGTSLFLDDPGFFVGDYYQPTNNAHQMAIWRTSFPIDFPNQPGRPDWDHDESDTLYLELWIFETGTNPDEPHELACVFSYGYPFIDEFIPSEWAGTVLATNLVTISEDRTVFTETLPLKPYGVHLDEGGQPYTYRFGSRRPITIANAQDSDSNGPSYLKVSCYPRD